MTDVVNDFMKIMEHEVQNEAEVAEAAEKIADLVNESAEIHERTGEREHAAVKMIRMSFALSEAHRAKKDMAS
jgi:hypothetical protein